MDKKIIEIAKRYAEKVVKNTSAKMVILYGSYARGNPREFSDIDIAVVFDRSPSNYLKASSYLFELVNGIDNRIEPVLLVKTHDKSGFLESILKHGSIIYRA